MQIVMSLTSIPQLQGRKGGFPLTSGPGNYPGAHWGRWPHSFYAYFILFQKCGRLKIAA